MEQLYTYIKEGLLTSRGSVADQMADSEEAIAPDLIEEWIRKHDLSEARYPVVDIKDRKVTLDCDLILDEKCPVPGASFDGDIYLLTIKKDDKDLIDWWNECFRDVVISHKVCLNFPELRNQLNLNMRCTGVIRGGTGSMANKNTYIRLGKGMNITLYDDNKHGPTFSTFSIYLNDLDDIRKITFNYPQKGKYYSDILDINLWAPNLSQQQRESIKEIISENDDFTSEQMQEIFGKENVKRLEKLISDKTFRVKSSIYINGFPRDGRISFDYMKNGMWVLGIKRNMNL